MKKIWQNMGIVAFWLSWPLLWVYLRRGVRTRVFVVHQGSVLLVHNWHSAGQWCLPGGGLHHGEDPKVGAVREALEETGLVLEPNQLKLLKKGESLDRGLSYKYLCYWTEVKQRDQTKGRILEITDVAWVPMSELNEKNAASDTLVFLDAWQQR